MNPRLSRATLFLAVAFALPLLGGCGASPPPEPAAVTADSPTEASASDASSGQANTAGSNAARFEVDGVVHEFTSAQGGMFRNAIYDAPDVEIITFETYTAANDLYAKVDVSVAKGADPVGEYDADMLQNQASRVIAGHGQVTLAVETGTEAGRDMFPSGGGRITITRDGDQYRADFEFVGDGMFRGKDEPAITGYLKVDALDARQ